MKGKSKTYLKSRNHIHLLILAKTLAFLIIHLILTKLKLYHLPNLPNAIRYHLLKGISLTGL